MAVNGVRQLKSLTLRYCLHGGSSNGMRQFILSTQRTEFEEGNPFLEIKELNKNGKHPTVIAEYLNGYQTQIDARNSSPEEIQQKIEFCVNKRGQKARTWGEKHRHVSSNPSIQGPWHPSQWLPVHVMKETEFPPEKE